jgi:hypothetical protein
MSVSVFFSWQSDRPEKFGKQLLETALHAALTVLSNDSTLDEPEREFVLETDTQGAPGSPAVVDVIFDKIDSAAIFVADMTFVGNRVDGRPIPNPNVLIEYGWALKMLGRSRILCVMNSVYGEPSGESLPFDMRHLRFPITYSCPADASAEVKKDALTSLTRRLTEELRAIFDSTEYKAVQSGTAQKTAFTMAPAQQGLARFRPEGKAIGIMMSNSLLDARAPKEVVLKRGPSFWFRIAPAYEQEHEWELTQIEQAGHHQGKLILPMSDGYGSFNAVRGADGWGIYATPFSGEEETRGVVFCFKSGEVWSIDTYPAQAWSDDGKGKLLLPPEPFFVRAAEMYIPFLRQLDVNGPLQWEAGIEGIEGYTFQHPSNTIPRHVGPFLSDVVMSRGAHVEGQSAQEMLAPFFERIFSEAGSKRPATS